MADNGDVKRAQMPLLGVILCCTSIAPDRRVELAEIASHMGAIHKLDLTSDVTHMIVGDTDTPKYKFVARERPDVRCLLPTWIDAIRESWLAGGETDVDALEKKHTLPTFQGLTICVTGFDDLAYRKRLEDLIYTNGGEYKGNLTKDVTHLVARVPSGTKYSFAGEWGIKIVSVEWVTQSLERGMILDEKLYNLLLPETERGQNSWVRKIVSTTSLGKRAREEDPAPKNTRKLRRTASAKLSSQNIGLWSDIVNGGTEVERIKVDEWEDKQRDQALHLGILKAEKSESEGTEPPGVNGNPKPQQRSQNNLDSNKESSLTRPERKEGIFHSKRFFMHGFDQRQSNILQKHLCSHQAEVVQHIDDLFEKIQGREYLLVPHTISSHEIPARPEGIALPVVTDMWVERCLHRRTLVEPQANITNTPFPCFPIPGFEELSISSTAFKDVDLLHLSKAVKLIGIFSTSYREESSLRISGATYSEYLTNNTSILICNAETPNAAKLDYALRWKIPVVKANWIWDCIAGGELKYFEEYLIPSCCGLPMENSLKSTEFLSKAKGTEGDKKPLPRMTESVKGRSNGRRQMLETSEDRLLAPSLNELRSMGLVVDIAQNDPSAMNPGSPPPQDPTVEEHDPGGEEELNAEDSAHTLVATTTPLREISSNSSPKPGPSADESRSPPPKSMLPGDFKEDTLGPAISSLLAHHQRSSTNMLPRPVSEIPGFGRRRRQLLGRAPSNISTRSNGSINFSRASSIDTMNTDGLGTPVESSSLTKCGTIDPFEKLRSYGQLEESHEPAHEHLQMTQLGYEDPNVEAYRERVVRKMGGVTETETEDTKGARKRVKSIGTVKDVVGKGAQGVARRTRQAMGRS